MSKANYHIGQLIHHRMFDYRGVVVDVDAEYEGSDDWYEQMAVSRPPKNHPWYHVLVDGSDVETYVAERNLVAESVADPIQHPMIESYFEGFNNGHYEPRWKAS
jgi:heat shock protein HspQ